MYIRCSAHSQYSFVHYLEFEMATACMWWPMAPHVPVENPLDGTPGLIKAVKFATSKLDHGAIIWGGPWMSLLIRNS
jgi:hypothetical protein